MSNETASLKQRIQELEELHRLAQSLSSIVNVYKTLEEIGDCCLKLCRAERVAILLLNPMTQESVHSLVRGFSPDQKEIDHLINTMTAGWIARHHQPLLSENIVETLGIKDPSEQMRSLGPALAVPLAIEGKTIGMINLVNSRNGRKFSEDDLRLATSLAPLASQFIHRAEMQSALLEDNQRLTSALRQQQNVHLLVGDSVAIKKVRETIARVASSSANVLLIGETGTGKELAAKTVHYQSPRAGKPFIAVNCAAIPESLVESELFGHERGAFTGATEMRKGKFESANEGTVFLDEISAMPLGLQAKLLRVLEERTFSRVGSSVEIKIDVRVIAATNKDLREAIRAGDFREDLFHRLNVVPIQLPPLRDRKEDIPILAANFLLEFSGGLKHFSAEAVQTLTGMEWRGNVRELRNCVERVAILVAASDITRDDLRVLSVEDEKKPMSERFAFLQQLLRLNGSGQDLLESVERDLVSLALQEAKGNASQAARLLGIHRNSLQRRLEKYNLDKDVASD
jgi:transcriptional regulator with GAF, ATPase, and Fis domain